VFLIFFLMLMAASFLCLIVHTSAAKLVTNQLDILNYHHGKIHISIAEIREDEIA